MRQDAQPHALAGWPRDRLQPKGREERCWDQVKYLKRQFDESRSIVTFSSHCAQRHQLQGARHRQERAPDRNPRALTYAACLTMLRLHMHLFLEHGVHAARRAATLQEGRVTFYNPKVEKKDAGTKSNTLKGSLRRADPSSHSHHTVVKDIGCGVHAINKSEHPTGSHVHSRMRHA